MFKNDFFLQELVIFASTYMLVSLSMDRFDAIARPMKFSRKGQSVRYVSSVKLLYQHLVQISETDNHLL